MAAVVIYVKALLVLLLSTVVAAWVYRRVRLTQRLLTRHRRLARHRARPSTAAGASLLRGSGTSRACSPNRRGRTPGSSTSRLPPSGRGGGASKPKPKPKGRCLWNCAANPRRSQLQGKSFG